MLCQQPNKVLFGHFVTTLNAAFEIKLALEDKGYHSGSENFNIPAPLRRTSKIHPISSEEHASFVQTQSHHTPELLVNCPVDWYADA